MTESPLDIAKEILRMIGETLNEPVSASYAQEALREIEELEQKEYSKPWRPRVAIDLDGTLTTWRRGGTETKIGYWTPGAKDAIRILMAAGIDVVVHTCRATWVDGGGYEGVREFLDREDLEDVEVWNGVGKPVAVYYIDDRAIPFPGSLHPEDAWEVIVATCLAGTEGKREPRVADRTETD